MLLQFALNRLVNKGRAPTMRTKSRVGRALDSSRCCWRFLIVRLDLHWSGLDWSGVDWLDWLSQLVWVDFHYPVIVCAIVHTLRLKNYTLC